MSGFLDQVPALIGVIIGAAGSHFAASRTEKARWERQYDTRWDKERRTAYAEYAHSVKSVIQVSARLAKVQGLAPKKFEEIETNSGREELTRLSAERAATWESVLLLGGDETIQAAREWHSIVFMLQDVASGQRQTTPDERDEWYRASGQARDQFYACARRDLDI